MDLIEFWNIMHNTYKSGLTLIIIALLTFSATAQKRTYSPYSRYGIGELQDGGFGRNAAMGRTGIALQNSYNLNNINPASYSGLDSMSFYFEGGLMNYSQSLKSTDASSDFSDMHFDYFAIGFPIAKWGFMSFGLQPASAVGYDFYEENTNTANVGDYTLSSAMGNGNTTKTYAGLALKPFKDFSLGVHSVYLFGKIRNSNIAQFQNDPFASYLGSEEALRINDIYFDFGVQYKIDINQKQELVIGGIYRPKTGINANMTKLVGQGTSLNSDGSMVNTIDTLQFIEDELKRTAFEMPEKIGFGVAYNIKDAVTLTAEYTLEKWSEAKFPDEITETSDLQKWAFGGEIIPNERATSYLSRLRYRFGTYYKKDYLILNEHQLTDFGISFGVGLPLKRTKTSFNLAFEWGQRGTTDYNLVKENYAKLTMNLTLHEFWFVKRKFD
nr:hypothetical protein [uncultured Carboxylicivirga sp.]